MSQATEVTSLGSDTRLWAAGSSDEHRWGYHVQVKDPDGTGIGAEIWLDGERCRYVKRYVVDVGVNRADEVTITFNAQSVNREPLP